MKPHPELGLFSLEDVRQFFFKSRKKVWQVFVGFFLLGLAYVFLTCPKFRLEATFLEGGTEGSMETSLKELMIQSISYSSVDAKAASLMRSNCVLKPFIEKEGLQIRIFQRGFFSKLYHRLYDNYTVIFKGAVKDIDDFIFQDVSLASGGASSYFLRFIDEKRFWLLDEKKKKIGKGEIHKPFICPNFRFTLTYRPVSLVLKKDYPMRVAPWEELAQGLRKGITIKTDKNNSKLLRLTLDERDRFRGARILNSLMDVYKSYLVEENEKLASAQLDYLEKRQEQMQKKANQDTLEYTQFLKERIGQRGFVSSEAEMEFYAKPYYGHLGRLHEIDCLQSWIKQKSTPSFLSSFLPEGFKEISSKIHLLNQEKDLIDLSLSLARLKKEKKYPKADLSPSESYAFSSLDWAEELDAVRKQISSLEETLQEDSLEKIPSSASGELSDWVKNLAETKGTPKYLPLKEEFTTYLTNLVRLLKTQESILQKRMVHSQSVPQEFLSMDLGTAKKLLVSYNNQLDILQVNLKNYQTILEKMTEAHLELSALGSIIKDEVSREVLQSLTNLTWNLQDVSNLTEKEKARIKKEIKLKKSVLTSHIKELARVDELTIQHIYEKITSLQQVMLDRIHQEISVLNIETKDLLEDNRLKLEQEKRILQNKLKEIKTCMQETLAYRVKELDFDMKNRMRRQIIQSIAQLVESKTISNNLTQIQSKPLDYAMLPFHPLGKSGFFLPIFLGILGALMGFLVLFIRALFKGLPVSNHTLKLLDQTVLGSLSSSVEVSQLEDIPDRDLETLRKIASFLEEGRKKKQVISLLHPLGANYAFSLLALLEKRKIKTLLVNCDLQNPYHKKEEKGWLTYLAKKEKSLPIFQEKGFAYLPSGGSSRFAVETFSSPDFSSFLAEVQKEYDWVFLYTRASLSQVESQLFLEFSTKTLVTLEEESIETLQPFVNWSYDEGKARLAFLRTRG